MKCYMSCPSHHPWLPELTFFKTHIRFLLTYSWKLQHKVTLSLDGERTLGLADNVLQLATSHCCDHSQVFSAVLWHTAYDVTYHNKPALSPSTCRCDISCGFHSYHRQNFPQQRSRCSSDTNSDSTRSMQSFLQRNPEFCLSYNFGDARLCQKYEQFSVQYCPTHKTNLFEGSQASPARPSYKRSIRMKISTEH